MSDPSDTTPLVDAGASSTENTTTGTSRFESSEPLKWYNYIVLVLFALTLLGAFLLSFASLWKVLFVTATLVLLLKVYHDHVIIPFKPHYEVLSKSFWITQVGFAYFIAPFFLVLLASLLFLVLGFTFAIIFMLTYAILAAVYPDAMAVLAEDLASKAPPGDGKYVNETFMHLKPLATSARNAIGAATTTIMMRGEISERVIAVKEAVAGLPSLIAAKVSVPSHVTRAVWSHVQQNYAHQQDATPTPKIDFDTNTFQAAAAKIWQDMINAGANRGVLVTVIVLLLLIMFFLFVVVGGIGVNALLEVVKYKLFRRHRLVPNHTALGVKGLGFIGITNAFFLALSIVISTSYRIVPTFLNSLIFAISALTDVAVLVVSQLLVVAAFSETIVLLTAEYTTLRNAWKTSVLFNFGLALLRVAPAARADIRGVVVDGRAVTESDVVPSLIALVVFGGARIALLHKFGMPFVARFRAAVRTNEETFPA